MDQIMKRLSFLISLLVFLASAGQVSAQKKPKLTFETIYRPVYGYLIDSLANEPFRNVQAGRGSPEAVPQSDEDQAERRCG